MKINSCIEEGKKEFDEKFLPTKYIPYNLKDIEMVMCGHCEKKITPNLIASFGNDHHDLDEMMCADCFAGACGRDYESD